MKLITISLVYLLTAVTPSLAVTKDQLLGHWRWVDTATSFSTEYVFRDDGSFGGVYMERGVITAKFTGTWSVEGDILRYVYISDTSGRAPVGAKDRDKVLEVKEGYYVIQNRMGAKHRYVRVE